MNRREFIVGLGNAVAWPLVATAQQAVMPIVGYLSSNVPQSDPSKRDFLKGLGEAGFVEGRNVTIEYRYARNEFACLPELAADLVRRRVDVLATLNNAAAVAAKAATTTIPIVFSVGGDPVALGLVASLSRPGENVTGASFLATGTTAKMLGVLHELVPNASIAALFNPANPATELETRETLRAARIVGVKLDVLTADNGRDIDAASQILLQHGVGGFIIQGDPLFTTHLRQLAAFALRHGIPAISQTRGFVDAGGLMSFGGINTEAASISGFYVGRILGGKRPSDLPVQQSTKIELVINLATAKALGLTIPETLLATADEVIQ